MERGPAGVLSVASPNDAAAHRRGILPDEELAAAKQRLLG
jgi:hypothetical protein